MQDSTGDLAWQPELILGGGRHFSPPGLVLLPSSIYLHPRDLHLFSDASVVPGVAHSGFGYPDYPSSEGALPYCSCLCFVGQGLG